MGTEITDGGQKVLDVAQARREGSAPTERLFTDDFVDHDPGEGQPAGGAGLAWYWEGFERSFSDMTRDIVETVATPGHLVTVTDLSGRHTGEYLGHAPTGRSFTVRAVQVFRFDGERLAERWGSTDVAGILQQLGLA